MTSPETRPGATGDSDEPDALGSRKREAVRWFLEVLALSGFAITQPVLDAFGNSPEHFVFRGATPTQIILFAALVALVPTVVLAIVTFAIDAVSHRAGRMFHVAIVAVLAALAGVQLGWRAFDLTSAPLLLLAVAVGGAVAALYLRLAGFRAWVRYTAALPVVAVALFLFTSPVSDLVRSRTVAAAQVELAETPPIVVLVLDELPTATLVGADGTIDAELFPNFDRLSEIGTWYRNNSTNSNNTTLAMPAMLTGRIPAQLQATLAKHPDNLFTLLGATYDIRADEAPLQLCPENLCRAVSASDGALGSLLGDARRLWRSQISISDPGGAGFDLLEETVAVEKSADGDESSASEVIAAAFGGGERLVTNSPARQAEFLEAIEPSGRPTLNYLHLQLPHGPFRFYPNGTQYWRPDAGADAFNRYALRGDSDVPARVHRQRHILQTQYADGLVGQLLDRLEDQDLLEESIVVVASDHGIGFEPGVTPRLNSEEALVEGSIDDVFWSALFMKAPGQDVGAVSDAPTQLIDVLPTIIDWLGADPGWQLDGVPVDRVGDRGERTLCRPVTEDGLFTVDCAQIDASDMLDELLDSAVGQFLPPGDPALRVYRAGPFGDLVGVPLDQMVGGDASPREVAVKDLDRFADVRADRPVPGLVEGNLASGDDGVVLAIALNGTIAALTESFEEDGEQGLVTAVLPRVLFVEGENDIAIFVVEGSTPSPTLRPVTLTAG